MSIFTVEQHHIDGQPKNLWKLYQHGCDTGVRCDVAITLLKVAHMLNLATPEQTRQALHMLYKKEEAA